MCIRDSIEPGFSRAYKKLINEGFATTFADGMALEHARPSAANSAVTPDEVAKRREAVQARGRQQ